MIQGFRRTQALHAVAALGAAGMFLGPEGWPGIDVGPPGSALLCAALWLSVVRLASLLVELPNLGTEVYRLRNLATRALWINLGMLTFAWMVIGSTIRRQDAGAAQLDERDLRIAHGAARFVDGALALLILWLVVTLVGLPEQSRTWLRPFIAANVLIALLVARTLAENIYTLWRCRRARA